MVLNVIMRFAFLPSLALCLLAPALFAGDASRDQIKSLIDGHHWAAVQPLLEKLVANTPQDAEANFFLGVTLLNQNKPADAVSALEKAAALAPTNSDYQRVLGDAYGMSTMTSGLFGKLSAARKCKAAYAKAVELDPKNLNARLSLMEYCRQAPGIAGGGMDEAFIQAEAIKQIDPETGRRAYATLYAAEKKFAEAFGLYDEILKSSPADYDALFQLGKLSATSGEQLDRGLASLRRCLQLTPPSKYRTQAPAHWRIGNILERQGDKPGARAAYEQAVAADPKFSPAVEALAKISGS